MMDAGERALEAILISKHRGAIACDPGGTCGFAWINRDEFDVQTAQIRGEYAARWLHKKAMQLNGKIDCLVIEQHVPRPGENMGRDARLTMQLVGELTSVATMCGLEIVLHVPGQMRTVKWCRIGEGVHAKDAAKHLVRFLLDDASENGLIRF